MMGRDKAGAQAQSANQSAVDVQRSRATRQYVQGVALKQLVRVAQDKFDLGPGATKGWDAIADSPLFGQSRAFYKSVSDIKPILFGLWGIGTDNSPDTVKLRDKFEKKFLPNYWDSDTEKKRKLNYLLQVSEERIAHAASYLNSVPDSHGRIGIPFKAKDAPMLEGERLRREEAQHQAERKALGLEAHPPVTFTRRFLRGFLWNTSDSLNVAEDVADNGINAALGRNGFHPGDAARNGIRDAGMRQELYARENPTKALIADTLSGYLSGKLEANVIKDSLEGAVRLAAPYATPAIKHIFKSEINNAEKQDPDSVLAAPLQVITTPGTGPAGDAGGSGSVSSSAGNGTNGSGGGGGGTAVRPGGAGSQYAVWTQTSDGSAAGPGSGGGGGNTSGSSGSTGGNGGGYGGGSGGARAAGTAGAGILVLTYSTGAGPNSHPSNAMLLGIG